MEKRSKRSLPTIAAIVLTASSLIPASGCATVTRTVQGACQGAAEGYDMFSRSPEETAKDRTMFETAYENLLPTLYTRGESGVPEAELKVAKRKYRALKDGEEALPEGSVKVQTSDYIESAVMSFNPFALFLQVGYGSLGAIMGSIGGLYQGVRVDIQNHLLRGKNGIYHPGDINVTGDDLPADQRND